MDDEMKAMAKLAKTLDGLDAETRARVWAWLNAKYGRSSMVAGRIAWTDGTFTPENVPPEKLDVAGAARIR